MTQVQMSPESNGTNAKTATEKDGTDTTQNPGEKVENTNTTGDESIRQKVLLEKAQNPSTVVRRRLDRWVDLD
ncbi:hypothetical protein TorRG33x02_106640 [Trema orientale]|uniref:Uncharacterized protein n=1 Tax=Trema orientale TaxID=63057 RepID=A0A2P5F7A2_TREOI|nr:hypothetical protein TorRG33x02_106640 [Trema orientale]